MSLHHLLSALAAFFLTLAAGAAESTVKPDIPYGRDPAQRFDVYLPDGSRPAPAILMVHGGGWARGDKEMGRVVDNKQARWLPKGLAFITTNYRMQPEAAPLEQARDVARALAAVQQNATNLGVDRSRIILMGHSAGAHLIALLAARPDLLAEAGARPPLGYVLLDSGALDVPAIMNARHFRLYDRAFGNNPADWRAASPMQQLTAKTLPVLAVCSSRRATSCPQAEDFVARATALGSRASVLPEDLSHGEINASLGEDSAYTAAVEAFMASLDPAFATRLGERASLAR